MASADKRRALVILAPGAEEIEVVAVVDVLRRGDVRWAPCSPFFTIACLRV